jgi:tRNA modification GTPase
MEAAMTIAAVSTAYGEGGIGIVRISGSKAGDIMRRLFVRGGGCSAGGVAFADRHMHYGLVAHPVTGEIIDEALFVFMRGPHTYTGEDVAEIHCHGSVVSLRRVLDAALGCGAAPASPGEFTQRAFTSGRVDLAQAEAVIDVVRAKTDASARAALAQLGGGLSARVSEVRGLLADALAMAAVHIDYPDDDKDFNDPDSAQAETAAILRAASSGIEDLIATAATGRILREGMNVVIAGAANTGKSSLLNALLRDSRAIVTDIPGTTRDSIEESVDIRGLTVRLTDTAGIRDTDSEIERIGIDRAKEALAGADLVIFLVDGSRPLDGDDATALRSVAEAMGPTPAGRLLIAISKSDLPRAATDDDIARLPGGAGIATSPENPSDKLYTIPPDRLYTIQSASGLDEECSPDGPRGADAIPPEKLYTIPVSAKTGDGLDEIEGAIEHAVYGGKAPQSDEPLVTSARHANLLARAAEEIAAATERLAAFGDVDTAEINIRIAYESLGEITGETATDDILDRVFSRFCVGK